MLTILIFIITILVLVVVHELGHFFAAKYFGVRVDEFGVGYPPRAAKLFTWKNTLFSLNWLPFGGFVKIFGEDGVAPDATSFAAQKLWKRTIIILAGIAANFLLAIVLYTGSFFIGSWTDLASVPSGAMHVDRATIVTSVLKDSPAELAGIKAQDHIEMITLGDEVHSLPLTEEVIAFVRMHASDAEPVQITLMRDEKEIVVPVHPKADIAAGKPGIGITLADAAYSRLPLGAAFVKSISYTWEQSVLIITTVGKLVTGGTLGGQPVASQLSGPIGIAQVTGQAFSLGFGSFLALVALISVNLAVLNLVPFPALDGGRLVLEFFTKDGVSRISPKVVSIVNQAGFALLILLMIYVSYHDVLRVIK